MARKTDNTWLWIAALGVGGYLWYKNQQAVAPPSATVPGASSGTLLLPPSPAVNSAMPVANAPVTSSPVSFAVNTTGLVPAATDANNNPVLQPGQTLALLPNGLPVQNAAGVPMVFPGANTGSMNLVLPIPPTPNKMMTGTGDCV